MALLRILEAPDPRLKQRAAPVAVVDDAVRALMDDMLETMYRAPGIGLAAPQVGVLQRIVVLDLGPAEARQPRFLVNPEIVWRSAETVIGEEGCLSLPEQFADIERAKAVRVRHLDRAGEVQEIDAEDLLARCLQHELDHLDGILFVDHLSALKRNMILRKLHKQRRQRA
jgi:peptide deformylase